LINNQQHAFIDHVLYPGISICFKNMNKAELSIQNQEANDDEMQQKAIIEIRIDLDY
jgi:hypothetical protein|tara:strand:+ start:943 stop:1113 length:171 start_codon:yes stop_codon:yes gene_type:complete